MGYIGDGPKPELEVGDISTKDVTATGDLTVDTNTLFVDASEKQGRRWHNCNRRRCNNNSKRYTG